MGDMVVELVLLRVVRDGEWETLTRQPNICFCSLTSWENTDVLHIYQEQDSIMS